MKALLAALALILFGGIARAQCYKQVDKPQPARDVAHVQWPVHGQTWDVTINWQTMSVSDNGEETAEVILSVVDDPVRRTRGDHRLWHLSPDRCNEGIDPQLSTVKLMGRDFLLVTVPDAGESGSVVIAVLYSIDDKGHLDEVFQGAVRAHYMRTPECRHLMKSYVRPENEEGSRISWVYEYPDVEWVKHKAECKKAKIVRVAYSYEWKNGCFPIAEPTKGRGERLIIPAWDEDVCAPGVGLVDKEKPSRKSKPPR